MNRMRMVEDLLKRLQAGGRLRPCGDKTYALTGFRGKRPRLAAAVIETLLVRGLLRREDGAIVIAKAGEDWLKDGARFCEQHQILGTQRLRDERGRDSYVVVNCAESPLLLLYRTGFLEGHEAEAGERLRRDYSIGQLSPRLGSDYSTPIGSHTPRPDLADTALAARQRFNAAMKAAGPGLGDILFDVCCYLKGLGDSERVRRWPRGTAKVVLKLALQRLAAHYGFGAPGRSPIRGGPVQEKGAGP